MNLCFHQGKVYRTNEYGLNIEVPPPYPAVTVQCPDRPYVKPAFGRSFMFLLDERVLKCYSGRLFPPFGFIPPGHSVETSIQEIKNYEMLGDHPNFLKYYGRYRSADGECLVLEYLPRAIQFSDITNISPEWFLDIVKQSLSALDYIHSRGITYIDIHNENLLWDPDKNRVVFIDIDSRPLSSIYEVRENRKRLIAELWILIGSHFTTLRENIEESRSNFSDPLIQEAIDIMLDRLDRDEIPVSFDQAAELIGKGEIASSRIEPQLQTGVPSGLTRIILVGRGLLNYEVIARYDPRTNQIFPPVEQKDESPGLTATSVFSFLTLQVNGFIISRSLLLYFITSLS